MPSAIIPCRHCGQKNRLVQDKAELKARCGKCGAQLKISAPVELNDRNYADFIRQSRKPVMIDFYSPSCGPCRMLAPVVESLARQFVGEVSVAKLDTSQNPGAAGQFGIRAVPTLVFLKNGREVERLTGAQPEPLLAAKMRKLQ